jgi:hypothetical protein
MRKSGVVAAVRRAAQRHARKIHTFSCILRVFRWPKWISSHKPLCLRIAAVRAVALPENSTLVPLFGANCGRKIEPWKQQSPANVPTTEIIMERWDAARDALFHWPTELIRCETSGIR